MSSGGRRGFFASLISGARTLVAELEADDGPRFTPPPATHTSPRPSTHTRPTVRPPGASAEFIAACTQCGACIEACPENTLAVGPDGFPVAEPWRSACALCPTTPCIAACEPGALVATPPRYFRLGTAHVSERLCLNTADPDLECDRCLDWCPVPGAIAVPQESETLVPTVDPSCCTGCGLCIVGCAAYPKAIILR